MARQRGRVLQYGQAGQHPALEVLQARAAARRQVPERLLGNPSTRTAAVVSPPPTTVKALLFIRARATAIVPSA